VDADVVAGGARRGASVLAGVRASSSAVVLVHDGARPLVTAALVDAVASAARRHGAAIPVLPVAETLKRLVGDWIGGTVDRDGVASAQTPQGADRAVLLDAFARLGPEDGAAFTDEAALLEAAGVRVAAVPGESENLKVTLPGDLGRAAALLAARLGPPRIGYGSDSHPFGPRDGLALGGILIADAPALHGHSDGDVVLHAIADALLGGAALGDLGRAFPAGDPLTRGIASTSLLADVVQRVAAAGFVTSGLDVTLVGARPHLGGARLDAMRAAIAAILGVDPSSISIKASTGNLDGPEGAGRSISARAVVSLVHP
jgi:2-C-methyl-D-erythritol 4-phosphate cytidylyltransferase/2-C-methyl-D-erythritol 2,4-cyclodiphosphate synthase